MARGMKSVAALGAAALALAACGGGSSKKKSTAAPPATTAAAAAQTTTTLAGATRSGFFQISVPSSSKADRFGQSVAVAVDGSNNPVVAFIDHDPNGDGKFDDSTISVDSLDAKTGTM